MRTPFLVLLGLLLGSPASALTITSADVDRGAVQVKGKDASPSATITWEGRDVATASRSGAFHFATTELPGDCVGEVGDGAQRVPATVGGCVPRPGSALVVTDADGRVVGPFVVDPLGYATADAVGLHSPDGAVLAAFFTNGFDASPFGFFFASDDCGGPPLLPAVPGVTVRGQGAIGGTLYYPQRAGTPITIRSRSSRQSEQACAAAGEVFTPPDRCCCTAPLCMTPLSSNAAPAGTIDVRDFVAPFRTELR